MATGFECSFLTIEGPNGSGKSELVRYLAAQLARLGAQVRTTCEPTQGLIGTFIRDNQESLFGMPLACMVAADRHWHVEQEISPSLTSGMAVISDRYVESSFVLQGLDGVDWDFLWELNRSVKVPHLSINLEASAKTLRKRLAARAYRTRFERAWQPEDELAMYSKCRAFLYDRGYRFLVLNTDAQSVADSASMVLSEVQQTLEH